jgi:hypothetical protein
VGSVDKDAGVLGCDDGVDDSGEVVDIGQGLDAENNIVKCAVSTRRGFFWRFDNCEGLALRSP